MRYELTKDLETGNATIDREHRELFDAVNKLMDACGSGKGRASLEPTMKFLLEYVNKHFSAQPCISLFEKEKRGKRCGRTETDGNAFGIDGRGRAGCGKNAPADAETAKAAGCAAGYGIATCAAGGSGCVFAQPQGKYDFRRHSLFESGISEGAVSGGAADGAAARDGR